MKSDLEKEKKEILNKYHGLLRDCSRRELTKKQKKVIRKAFDVALEAHKDMRRKSGEPYIYHPIAVARIAAGEIGLGTTSVVCALLHDVVEDTELTLDDMEKMFGPKVASIIDGLTKISGVFDSTSSLQAENFRKMLLTLSDDVRVILIKLADRLHNMRTLEVMRRDKQLKIASETLYLYAPLAHRLGLYAIKSELEDLGLKYTEPDIYKLIQKKLTDSKQERSRYISRFTIPVKESLRDQNIKFQIKGRTKSIFSIWNKMQTKDVEFEEVYDLFAIRIILDSYQKEEKADCWRAYSIVTDFYKPNPDRLRDWVSTPKANGYESLHTTVMGPKGKWVEVQIRSERMDDIAEKGYAAHWKYKEGSEASALDQWINRIQELLENPEPDALDFIDDFKMNLFSDEIFVFTPKGELITLPAGATALDFAYEIHTQIGNQCIGTKVNRRLVPLSSELKSGDQVEVITSIKNRPKEDRLKYVITARAKSKIKASIKAEQKKAAVDGREILERKLKNLKINADVANINKLLQFYGIRDSQDLYYRVAIGNLDLKKLKEFTQEQGSIKTSPTKPKSGKSLEELVKRTRGKSDTLVIGEELQKIDYKLAPCCNPIPGDDVFGFITINEGIKIHRVNCPNAIQLMSNYAYRIVKARWTNQELIAFLAGLKITGIDDMGIVNNITKIISTDLNVNMRSLGFDSEDGVFEGTIMLYVHDTTHLTDLITNLKKVKGVSRVERIH
ncbi:MAG: bifunctional (p)ppGpp synthetase/guanosine-3',5'-bis(diphosphate) 3'-pyrophosphohydrolase [Flavobacteriales bacterium]|nr:bifunctional (p)ppGpp synthetase/guanosine-3',5'-bis(diphosphate) 3'-pyrophosphohydrolase [Flavobacteriales bacterium]